jgi:hypothetical protein
MRGYTDTASLLITLGTEWPALIMGVAAVERLGGLVLDLVCRNYVPYITTSLSPSSSSSNINRISNRVQESSDKIKGTTVFASGMFLALALLLSPHLRSVDDKDAMAYLIPLVPGQHMQSVGTAYLRARTCLLPEYVICLISHIACMSLNAINRRMDAGSAALAIA